MLLGKLTVKILHGKTIQCYLKHLHDTCTKSLKIIYMIHRINVTWENNHQVKYARKFIT